MGGRPSIPPDHLISPLEGKLIAPLSLGPTAPWSFEVFWARHLADYLEIGQQEMIPCAPTTTLHHGRAINWEMGWCVDA